MHFTKLRLSGFKSFVDPIELLIEPGLTGVVGPNGCGKSNLVEALRWVMGETSARRMRGGEMDDIIFAGSSDQPARNVAEVTVVIDNSDQRATPPFQNMATLEIARRIERQSGSSYRINGQDVRARDVQLLFADAGTGAQSNGLVSQGRVSAIINAKPFERRKLLEEAARISGLESRRHEAELKLKAAEGNLERLDDVIQTMEAHLKNLQSQARHAGKYRRLQAQIRETEALYLYLKWQKAQAFLSEAARKYHHCETAVAEFAKQQAHAAKYQTEAAIILPDLRKAEAEAGAKYQRLMNATALLDSEEQRVAEQHQELQNQIAQMHQDQMREKEVQADAENEYQHFQEERETLTDLKEEEKQKLSQQERLADDAQSDLQNAEDLLSETMQQFMQGQAQANSLTQTLSDIGQRISRQQQRIQVLQQEKTLLAGQTEDVQDYEQAEEDVLIFEENQEHLEQEVKIFAEKNQQASEMLQQQTEIFHQKRDIRDRLLAEMRGLEKFVHQQGQKQGTTTYHSVLMHSTVLAGYEAAFGAVMTNAVEAPLLTQVPTAGHGWRYLPILPVVNRLAYPCLADFVECPKELKRFLGFCFIVPSADAAQQNWQRLSPGMILVSQSGDIWRWDGYFCQAGQHSQAASVFLEQQNRLSELQNDFEQAEAICQQAQEKLTERQAAQTQYQQDEKQAQIQLHACFQKVTQARKELAQLANRVRQVQAQMTSQTDLIQQAEMDLQDLHIQQTTLEEQISEQADLTEQKQRLSQYQEKVDQLRRTLRVEQSKVDRLTQEAKVREHRLQELTHQLAGWEKRCLASRERVHEFDARLQAAVEMLETLAEKPNEIVAQRDILFDQISLSKDQKRQTADLLATAETKQREAQMVLKEVEAQLSIARENRARAEGRIAQAKLAVQTFVERIQERLSCAPEKTLETVGLTPDHLQDQLDDNALEQQIQKLSQDRENMGAVNLRAEQEVEDMTAHINALTSEREDLIEAISRLRQAIQTLNREARDRLNKAFEAVNQSFETLFVQMFGGGHAHLSLTDPQDPLSTGVEIMASPPGKKLQIMSLLSGGEQALTALALIFAVFQSNPAPICVLDEVDAPLDDANVDRFCTLIEEMAARGKTRFLVVTHHRMTMARVHRLFGVTMRERGISQLVSVDLQQAGALVD